MYIIIIIIKPFLTLNISHFDLKMVKNNINFWKIKYNWFSKRKIKENTTWYEKL